jgi:putative component of membrane protein insertase Oxa1/YidC/SpoIIIJ protein YidD
MRPLAFAFFLSVLMSPWSAFGQSSFETTLKESIYRADSLSENGNRTIKGKLNVVNGLFNFYKKNISDQIINDCIYEVSCSEFSRDVFEHYGLVKGLFLTCDRLCRCNRLSYEEAPRERINKQGKLVDRWGDYRFDK